MLLAICCSPSVARSYSAASDATGAAATALPGREADARVAGIAYALARAGLPRCPVHRPATGMVLQHLTQFQLADRPGMIAAFSLDRGPGVVAVVAGSPAADAGIRPGDVLLAVGGVPLPYEPDLSAPFSAPAAHNRADRIDDLVRRGPATPLTLLRGGVTFDIPLTPLPACPSQLHLARSEQRNAYADGRHVFLTTGLLADLSGDDELAFVIAHEMAHNILGHAATMRGGEVRRGLGRMLGRSGRIVRASEEAADALAGELLLDTGYDPVAGAGVLRRLDRSLFGIDLFAGHASAGGRIDAMRALAEARRAR